jgi:hypothetical protein
VNGKRASQMTHHYYEGNFILELTDVSDNSNIVSSAPVSAPNTPHKQSNFFMTLEVPLEIAQTTEMTWTMAPHSTPAHPKATNNLDSPDTPGCSPVRPGPISTLHFGVKSPSKQPKLSTEDSDILRDVVHGTKMIKTELESAPWWTSQVLLQESIKSPSGVYQESIRSLSGVNQESTRSPSGVNQESGKTSNRLT